jgi:hypothetical protein
MLYEKLNDDMWPYHFEMMIEDPVHHVYISSTNAIQQCASAFPKVTKLTLVKKFNGRRDLIAMYLNRIIPLRQLTQLNLNCRGFPLQQIIKLLQLTPNVHTLKLDSILLYDTTSTLIEQNEIFRIVSNTNIVTNVTIVEESKSDKIQLLVALFPRLEHLKINLYDENFESIARFLLSNANSNTWHLSSLCIPEDRYASMSNSFMKKLRILIESEKLLDDYTLKTINREVYLWW